MLLRRFLIWLKILFWLLCRNFIHNNVIRLVPVYLMVALRVCYLHDERFCRIWSFFFSFLSTEFTSRLLNGKFKLLFFFFYNVFPLYWDSLFLGIFEGIAWLFFLLRPILIFCLSEFDYKRQWVLTFCNCHILLHVSCWLCIPISLHFWVWFG